VGSELIVERLDGETLVYDPGSHEAHALSGAGAAEFLAAEDEVSRRGVLRKLALAGAAAAGTAPLIKSIVAPAPAHSGSNCACPTPGNPTLVCGANQGCGPGIGCFTCQIFSGQVCPGSSCVCCDGPGACTATFCLGSFVCCSGTCCATGETCVGGVCTPPSDRNIKHHLAPAAPQDVLAALGL
jgi:hypothetical protein